MSLPPLPPIFEVIFLLGINSIHLPGDFCQICNNAVPTEKIRVVLRGTHD